ncbi:MAG: LacI family DNA-binding transcriptional regulator [Acidimicrobiia bacterium]|nr:LacI family DNA-binding transcriptional regulator [Acidimicrobiia bacterium]
MTSRPKLQEVSERTGVSLATVSRVLNGKAGVAGATRQLVLDAVAELGYAPRPARSGQSPVVGIITPELDNPIFPTFAQTIEARLARREIMSLVCPSTSETINEQDYLDRFVEWEATGVVVINGRYAAPELGFDPYVELERRGLNVVLVNGLTGRCPVPAVAVDIRDGAMTATRHLIGLGHRRIGVLTGPGRYASSDELISGYGIAMAKAELPMSDDWVSETLYTLEGGRAGVASLLEADVTGIVCGSDLMAVGAIAGVRAWGKSVPEDVSVVGFDGTQMMLFTDPPLTTLRQPIGRMATTVATLIDAPENASGHVHMFQPDLVTGGSTGPAPHR